MIFGGVGKGVDKGFSAASVRALVWLAAILDGGVCLW